LAIYKDITLNNHANGYLSIDTMVVDSFILKNNQITLSPCFTFIRRTGVGLPKTGTSFYREDAFVILKN